jgi:hypothetical protein
LADIGQPDVSMPRTAIGAPPQRQPDRTDSYHDPQPELLGNTTQRFAKPLWGVISIEGSNAISGPFLSARISLVLQKPLDRTPLVCAPARCENVIRDGDRLNAELPTARMFRGERLPESVSPRYLRTGIPGPEFQADAPPKIRS